MSIASVSLSEKHSSIGCWPFTVDEFDRKPELTPKEIEALSAWNAHWKTPNTHSLQIAELSLIRLTQPIDKVFTLYGNDLRTKRSARSFLLNEMHKRQTSIWAWREQEWLECIGRTYEDFRAYHIYRSKNVRNYIMACAYLISDTQIIQHVTDYQQRVFASRIFGTKNVFSTLNIVANEMSRLGYQKTLIHNYAFVILCEAILISRSYDLYRLPPTIMTQLSTKYSSSKKNIFNVAEHYQ